MAQPSRYGLWLHHDPWGEPEGALIGKPTPPSKCGAGFLRIMLYQREACMNEDVFNTSLRSFLKKVGITAQREIEKAVREAIVGGRLKGNEMLLAKMTLTIGGVSLTHDVTDEIELG
jgi:hypothetical protein